MSAGARLLRWFGAATVVLVAAAGLAVAAVEWHYTCYDACYPQDTLLDGWQYRDDAWQWDLQFGLAGLGFLLAVSAVWLVLRDRPVPATVCIVLSVLSYASWWSVLASAIL